ncbi:hypothetical protein [Streptomyces celluloflavus]|nr:hypothetical protein OG717_30275 [Streptomyces celluloflavus]
MASFGWVSGRGDVEAGAVASVLVVPQDSLGYQPGIWCGDVWWSVGFR